MTPAGPCSLVKVASLLTVQLAADAGTEQHQLTGNRGRIQPQAAADRQLRGEHRPTVVVGEGRPLTLQLADAGTGQAQLTCDRGPTERHAGLDSRVRGGHRWAMLIGEGRLLTVQLAADAGTEQHQLTGN